MLKKPIILISAVSRELHSARQVVANALASLDCAPVWLDFPDGGTDDLRDLLRQRIEASAGVVQLIGRHYGAEPPTPDPVFGRCSYTQYEALYARQCGRPVLALLLDDRFPVDPSAPEAPELAALQAAYAATVRATEPTAQPLRSLEALEARVLDLQKNLARYRRRQRRWIPLALALLVLSVGVVGWALRARHRALPEAHSAPVEIVFTPGEVARLTPAIFALPSTQARILFQQPGQKLDQIEDRAYADLAPPLGLDEKKLHLQLPALAKKLQAAPGTPTWERAHAAYVAKDYPAAEQLALQAAAEPSQDTPAQRQRTLEASELAGQAAEQRFHEQDALRHLHAAEALTDRQRDSTEWIRIQFALARLLDAVGDENRAAALWKEIVAEQTATFGPESPVTLLGRLWFGLALANQGQAPEGERELREVIALETRLQGPEHPDTLKARTALANTLRGQSHYAAAEQEYRAILAIQERLLGPEDPETLRSRYHLANALSDQGQYLEGEQEHRAVLALRTRLLGSEHPDTLSSRNNLANALRALGQNAEAAREHRAVLAIRLRLLGPNHPQTLISRSNLANALHAQGLNADAEREHRVVLAIRERDLGSEHPDTLRSRSNVANALSAQGQNEEAEQQYREVLIVQERVLGPDHVETLRTCYNLARALRDQDKFPQALEYARRAEEGWRKTLGAAHPWPQSAQILREGIEKRRQEYKAP